jgi:RNA polymerase sigma-70 factor (ECF subfamily)
VPIKWNIDRKDARWEEDLRRQMVALLPRMRRFAYNLTGDRERGDDLVQAACERALVRLGQFRDGSRFDSWLFRIIHTQWIDRVRRRQTREAHARTSRPHPRTNTAEDDPSGRLAALMDVRNALTTLQEEQRAAVSLVVVEGHTYAEAANILDVPAGTVASRVARARQELVRQLQGKRPDNLFTLHAGAGAKDTHA